jgi:hypothetical protein
MLSRILITSSSLSKKCTIGPLAKLNSMVSSWTTNGKATTAGSLLVFGDNVGEEGLSTQSTYKVNIDCLYYKACIAPNPKVLNDLKPSKEQLENVYWGIMKEVNDLQLQIDSKKNLSCVNRQGKSFNTNIAKVKAQNVVFWPLDDIELVDWTTTFFYLQDYGFVRISITHLFSNWQSKKQFRNLPIGICQASCFKMIQTMKKISLLGLCLHTKRRTVDILPYSQLCRLPY